MVPDCRGIPQKIKDWGGIAAALAAIWLIVDKVEIPDSVEPATVGYVNGKVEPLEAGNKSDAKNWAVRNIAYYYEKLCAGGVPAERRNELRELIAEEFANYEWATGRKHGYDPMSESEVCIERGS